MSGDLEQEYFADGIAEDIITALSRFSWFFVIARNSSFSYKGEAVDVHRIGPATSACSTCSRAACGRPATGFASPLS